MPITYRTGRLLPLAIVSLFALSGCVTEPVSPGVEDDRLDRLLLDMDQSLASLAAANAQLQAQQRQLELQQQSLAALHENLGQALSPPEEDGCPQAVACPPPPEVSAKMMVGGLEDVWFSDLDMALTARVDTGSATASLDARDIEQFERNGKPWVRFGVIDRRTGGQVTLERMLVRTVGIQQPGTTRVTRRPVVRLGIVIGQFSQRAEFSLSDRGHMVNQVVIGRNILKDVMVVDVSRRNMAPYVLPESASGDSGNSR